MLGTANVGKSIKSIKKSDRFEAYSKVILKVSDTVQYTSGSDTGRALTVECPWGTQSMANNILSSIDGFAYQPYSATGAIIDPAAELGDNISVGNVSGGIYEESVSHGKLTLTDVSAPGGGKIDYAAQFKTKKERETIRAIALCNVGIRKVEKDTDKKILEQRKTIIAALNGDDGAPEDLAAGFDSYVKYDLSNNEAYASSQLFAAINTTLNAGLQTKVSSEDLKNKLKNYALANDLEKYLTVSAAAELYVTDGDVRAAIGTYIVTDSSGNKKTLAAILADQIKLQGDTEILGNLTIVDGNLKSTRGIASDNAITGASIYANGTGTQGIISGRRVSCSEIAVGGKEYTPTEITSKTGTVRVLGIA